ncbi:TraY domain-containing protein [Salmonella enterica subsp. enterica]|uniref:TraY domain-containing protein n=1 Tax=Salmonella enterica TaxID=28901 RepID=UPI000A1958C0|nr:TraY domain-containing protein [Salmonella enterica]EDW7342786.1 TraY domain-containing protein [Salmonella enterica subsp. enterica serovar London]EEG4800064.1 TraY domain-containing protein [Salmonella enterica subsp. enterica]EAP0061832.1 TraY domain-containing protein [Salmonella enterica]EAS2455478.1 TraY domain-containing protein [Salmonella enterica]EAU0597421.1 TraY domain-containing protein [Salmonella enterica]
MKEPKSNIRNLIDLGGLIGKKVNISCSLDESIDEILMESAIKSGRSKKREAELRLEDHLRRFSLVPTEEQYVEKKTD